MPLFNLECPKGHFKKLLTSCQTFDKVPVEKKTCQCGELMTRKATGPTSSVKERLDNGIMPKAVERFADTERLYKERNEKADPNAGGKNRS